MRPSLIYTYALAATFMMGAFAGAEEAPENVKPGIRAMSHAEWIAIQQDREEKEEAAKTVSTAESIDGEEAVDNLISAPEGAAFSASTYYTTHSGAFHNPISVGLFGEYIMLEDGSTWTTSKSDAHKTLNWLTSDLVVITANKDWFSSYMFRITNQNTGVSVKCNLSLGPIYNGIYTHWIVGINYFTQEICLEDGSIWKISGFDSSISDKWLVNDTIIIGVNDGFLSSSRPNILINVNTLTFARANCTY